MRYAQLGTTGVFVSRLTLGTATFGRGRGSRWSVAGGLDATAADRLIGVALEHGINLIDTAGGHADGDSETILGQVLGARRGDILLATRLANRTGPGPNDVGLTRLNVAKAIEDGLRRLRTDCLDLCQIPCYDPVTPIEETLTALTDAVRQGKVRYLGASDLAAWQMSRALGISRRDGLASFVSLQSCYSLVTRDVEAEIVPMARAEGLSLLAYSPLAGNPIIGNLNTGWDRITVPANGSGPARHTIGVAQAVADRHAVTVPQVALAWLLGHDEITSAIVGARHVAQLEQSLDTFNLRLSDEDYLELELTSARPPGYPQWIQSDESWRMPPGGETTPCSD